MRWVEGGLLMVRPCTAVTHWQSEMIEYTDAADRPLMVAPWGTHSPGLMYRVAGVAVFDSQRRVCIRKREIAGVWQWDISATAHVRRGEAREDAALRALNAEFDLTGVVLREGITFISSIAEEPVRFSLFAVRLTYWLPNDWQAGRNMLLDEEELQGLGRQMPELLTPALVWISRSGILWAPDFSRGRAHLGNGPVLRG